MPQYSSEQETVGFSLTLVRKVTPLEVATRTTNQPTARDFPAYHTIIRTQMRSTELSLSKIIMYCEEGYLKESWGCYDSRKSF